MPNMARHIFENLQKKSRIPPLPELLNAHKTNIEQQPLELPTARVAAA